MIHVPRGVVVRELKEGPEAAQELKDLDKVPLGWRAGIQDDGPGEVVGSFLGPDFDGVQNTLAPGRILQRPKICWA